jgi:hypothetical protein
MQAIDSPGLRTTKPRFFFFCCCCCWGEGGGGYLATGSGDPARVAKGQHCTAAEMRRMTVVVRLDNGEEVAYARLPMDTNPNGVPFGRCQVPLALVVAGIVHI